MYAALMKDSIHIYIYMQTFKNPCIGVKQNNNVEVGLHFNIFSGCYYMSGSKDKDLV